LATRREFLNALKQELPDALRLLQSGNVAPVDLAQAAIGPGMAVFSRYAKVVEADGSSMTVRTALTLINQILDEVLAEQEGDFDAPTRWAVAWFEQQGTQEGPYGVAEVLSKAKNTSVRGLSDAGIVKSRAGSVQLLGRDDLSADWDPAKEKHLTAWEATQHLILALDQEGESGAADLLQKLGGDYGYKARDLAYRLFSICERKKWAQEALAYNSLVVAWPELVRLANQMKTKGQTQGDLF
jgi:putative DNA methylase